MRTPTLLACLSLLTACPPEPDLDGDGFTAEVDCDDSDPLVNPAAEERCSGVDDDCDGLVDDEDELEDLEDALTSWRDEDGDGFGDATQQATSCMVPEGFVTDDTDCDDTNAGVHPSATEVCNDIDDDCDGALDDADADVDLDSGTTSWADADGDGYGDPEQESQACVPPEADALVGGDCDDADVSVNPAALEICNERDDDCDGLVDDDDSDVDTSTGITSWADADGDGYGDPEQETQACVPPVGDVLVDGDCDDADASVNPAVMEICDERDDDCDGLVDDDDPDVELSTGTSSWADADGDGYGDVAVETLACLPPAGDVLDSSDCNDGDATVNPGASELCDDIDNDCDGLMDDADPDVDLSTGSTWYTDRDRDGYGDPGTAVLACQGGSRLVSVGGDCNDLLPLVNPAASETCSGLDDDCDGLTDDADPGVDLSTGRTYFDDTDGDGHGDASISVTACAAPSGYVAIGDDCDPSDGGISPSAVEVCEDGIDQNCSGSDRTCGGLYGLLDADSDAYSIIYSTEYGSSLNAHATLDWDGDGQQDLMVAANLSDEGTTDGGAAYVMLGPISAGAMPHDSSAAAMLYGLDGRGYMGGWLDALPDLDGDGADEVYIGTASGTDRGLVPGGTLTSGAYVGDLVANTAYCTSAVSVGDQDGDGTGDWACGSSGGSVTFYDGFDTTSWALMVQSSRTYYVGGSLIGGDDLDGDGVADLWVSCQGLTYDSVYHSGGAFLVSAPFTSLTFSETDAAVAGSQVSQEVGSTIGVADLNGDGHTDYLAGACYDDTAAANAGALYGWYGPLGSSTRLDSDADLVVLGHTSNLGLGAIESPAGDLDGDGQDDLVVVGPSDDTAGTNAGAAWVFYGPLTGSLTLADAQFDGAEIRGSGRNATLSSPTAISEGLTGAGSIDLIMGAGSAGWGSIYSGGVVYLFSTD